MMKIAERNYSGQYYVNTRLGVAKTKQATDFPEFAPGSDEYNLLTDLIEVNAKGFRGVVVTALTGLHLDDKYDPLDNFYGCNPRSIFEEGIWYALHDNGIPCGKSDPLNVAKNINQLNESWAQGKRPQTAAMAAVTFLRMVIASNKAKRARLIDYFFYRLWVYARRINAYQLATLDVADTSRQVTGTMLVNFTLKYPESGYLPQYVVGQLLVALFRTSNISVVGGSESVFGTNTTSKKPADIWLEAEGMQTNLYEVTVKPVTRKRLDDSIDALRATGHLHLPVTYICRLDTNVKELDVVDGCFQYKGKRFDFVDYGQWCLSLCALLSENSLSAVMDEVTAFIRGRNISMKTKAGWNEFFGN